jgi:hypothetical protein
VCDAATVTATSPRDRLVEDPWEAIEACYDAGWTDGLPVVPPTEPLVDAMLASGPWAPTDPLLVEPSRGLTVTAHHAAVNAVLAGCRPEYFPVVGAVLQAMGEPVFGLHAVATSTGGAAVLIAVNGPVRDELGIHYKENLFGPGFRANATIGRTVRLVLRNCLVAIPGVLDKSTQGWPGKYSLCFGEDEASSPWEPYHVSRGFEPPQSTVTIMAAESGHNVLNHASEAPEGLLATFADTMAAFGSFSPGRSLVVFSPEHAGKLGAAGWSRRQVQEFLYERTVRSLADLKRGGKVEASGHADGADSSQWFASDPNVQPGDEDVLIHRGVGPDDIHLMVGGGDAGGHSAFFPTWSRTRSVTLVTKEVPFP